PSRRPRSAAALVAPPRAEGQARGAPLSEEILAAAGRALGGARLVEPEVLKSWARNDVWRCRVAGGPSGLPTSVIVKHFKSEPDGLRDALAPRELTPISRAAAGLSAAEPDVTGWLTAVGTRVPRGLAESLAALADAVAHPGPFTTFTHGDMAPSNNHFSATG